MRLVDAMMSLPDILLAIALVGVLGRTMLNVVFAPFWCTRRGWRGWCAPLRSLVRELLYIEAARAIGASALRIVLCPS